MFFTNDTSNFNALRDSIENIRLALLDEDGDGNINPDDLESIKAELNKFFTDSTCKEVIYTVNTDRMFFGIKLNPLIDADNIYDYLVSEDPIRIDTYAVELDSHLFDPGAFFNADEILAVLLYEVSRLINDATPMEMVRDEINGYLAANKKNLSISKSIHYKEILAYGVKDYLSKCRSMFYEDDSSKVIGDEFILRYYSTTYLDTAYSKIKNSNIKLYENSIQSKLVVLLWTLNIYSSLRTQRVGSIQTLTMMKKLTGSRIEQREIDNVIRRINRIDDDILVEAGGIKEKIREKLRKSRMNNLKTLENMYYELSMQIKNVEDENDALYLMRQINNGLSITDEYRNNQDFDEYEKEMWTKLHDRFYQLREKLVQTTTYKNRTYGIVVNYPDIVENRY